MANEDRLELQITGYKARQTAAALRDRIAAELGDQFVEVKLPIPTGPVPESTTLEVIGLIIAVPSAMLAAMDVAKRLLLKKRLQPIWDDVMKKYDELQSEIEVKPATGSPRPAEAKDLDQLVDTDQPGGDA